MAHPAVDTFGKLVVNNLRDRALDHHEKLVQGHWRAASLAALHRELEAQSPETLDLIRRCVVNAVDVGMHDLLFALGEARDRDELQILVDGEDVAELSDGLQGEPWTQEGWIARFGKFPEQER